MIMKLVPRDLRMPQTGSIIRMENQHWYVKSSAVEDVDFGAGRLSPWHVVRLVPLEDGEMMLDKEARRYEPGVGIESYVWVSAWTLVKTRARLFAY